MGAASISVLPQQRVNCVPWCCVLLLRRTAVRVGRSAWRSFAQRAKAQQELPLHFNSCPTPRTSDRGCATSEAALSSLYGGTNSPIFGVTLLGGRRDIRSNLSYLGDTHPAIVVASAPGNSTASSGESARSLCSMRSCSSHSVTSPVQIGFGTSWALLGSSLCVFSSTRSLIARGLFEVDGAAPSLSRRLGLSKTRQPAL